MQKTNGIKRFLPDAIVIIAFLIISALYCAPALKGNRIAPHDTISWMYMSKEARDYYAVNGKGPGWSNSMFGGSPASMIYQPSSANWYNTIFGKVQLQPDDGSLNPIMLFFLAMVSFFLLMKALRLNSWLSGIASVAFAFTSYHFIIIAAGHVTKMIDLLLFPGVIAGIIYIYRGRYALGTLLFGIFMALFIGANHFQIIYYGVIVFAVLGLAFLFIAIRQKQLMSFVKGSLLILLLSGVSLLLNYASIIITSDYSKYSIRGNASELTINKKDNPEENKNKSGLSKDYAFQWSNGIGETFCILVPNLYGGQSGENIGPNSKFGEALSELGVQDYQVEQMTSRAPTYWGPQPFLSGPIYFGAIVCFLFVLALFAIKSPLKWWITALSVLFMMLSWGKNFEAFNYFLFDHLPLYNKFRTPSMALSITGILFPLLGFWGLHEFMSDRYTKEQRIAMLKKALYITGGLTVLILLYSQTMMSFKGDGDAEMAKSYGEHANNLLKAIREDRQSLALKDSFRSLLFILIAAGAIWAYATEKLQKNIAVALLGLFCIIDLWGVGHRYEHEETYTDAATLEQNYYTPRPVDVEILKDKDPDFRVLDLSINTFNDAKSSYFYKTIGGYHAAKLQIYQDLIETQISKLNSSVLNMLNTKYIITQGQQPGQERLIPNPNALGNAWFVSEIHFTKTADETILSMNAPSIQDAKPDSLNSGFNALKTAVIRDQYRAAIGADKYTKDSTARIKLTKYDLPALTYESVNDHDGFAVFSEIYYPENWKAFVDGKETPIYCVNYVLRGIKVPAGKHEIKFIYEDKAFKKAENITTIGSIVLTVIMLAALVMAFIKRNKPKEETPNDELV
ncbi:YfhO family protein [Edaphocola flava]|uniref:YfhO family protein n=1 Tax=Edaphocola flava TaxID=2499629 RepID=UPI00100A7609|nr:YfhO family protein [Edaphocola flava]